MARTDIATRASVVILKSAGVNGQPMPTSDVVQLMGIPRRTVDSIFARACERGFDPTKRPIELLDEYLEDSPRSGRPKKNTEENQ